VVRGLHYQLAHGQDKLIYVVRGAILDVAVDIRPGSPAFGRWTGHLLSEENRRQLFVPRGFAHGFSVLSDVADVTYKCSEYYTPGDEYGIAWDDPDLSIDWRVRGPVVSDKDRRHPRLRDVDPLLLPSLYPF
jgi:dTDP-4-dehydrorhamnose 3,5-epimerase